MSVQVVAAKMAEVELKDVPTGKDLSAGSPMSPTSEDKSLPKIDSFAAGSSGSAAASLTVESSAKAGDSSPGLLTPNAAKLPQASAMKRTDPQQNGGEAFVNRDGTVAEAPRMKKVKWDDIFLLLPPRWLCYRLAVFGPPPRTQLGKLALCDDASKLALIPRAGLKLLIMGIRATNNPEGVIEPVNLNLMSISAPLRDI